MRISGCFLGAVSFFFLIVLTGVCSILAYSTTRGAIIDLWGSGVRVESIGDTVRAVVNPRDFQIAVTPTISNSIAAVIPSITPVATITPTAAVTDTGAQSVSPDIQTSPAAFTPTPEPTLDPAASYRWTDPRQIRILLLGIDQRVGYEEEAVFRSDTIILVNIDPVRKTVGAIWFPRDLWVDIPNIGKERINTAMRQGDLIGYPGGGGPALAMETIASNFGVRVDRYIVVNFTLVETVVDTLAPQGVEICVREPILDTKYPDAGYGFMTVQFDPGCQMVNGVKLLQYARTRATANSDFDRVRRQQEAIDAVRAQVVSGGGITNLLTQIPTLWNELSNSYRTNLTLEEIIKLGYLMTEIPRDNIVYTAIDTNYVDLGKSPAGDDVLIPYYSRITTLISRVLYPQVNVSQADLLARSQAENATIRVFNGTDIAGLAGRTQEWLIGKGVSVAETGNATNHGGKDTVIRYYSGEIATAEYLASVLGLSIERIEPGTDGLAADGIVIVVGPDIQSILGGQ
jgi:LCP family protein required for cell wall assembly